MANPFDRLASMTGEAGDVMREQQLAAPSPLETPSMTADRLASEAQSQARVQRETATDYAQRGIPTYKDESGSVTPVRDESGAALTHFDKRNNVAWDSQGQPKALSFGETGAPSLVDPYETASETVDKAGNKYKVAPGLPWKHIGTDPEVSAAHAAKERDKAISSAVSANRGKLTLEQAELSAGERRLKALREEMQSFAPPEALSALDAGDVDTALSFTDSIFDDQYKAGDANLGIFQREFSPETLARRQQIDTDRANAHKKVRELAALSGRLGQLRGTVEQQRTMLGGLVNERAQNALAALGVQMPEQQEGQQVAQSSSPQLPSLGAVEREAAETGVQPQINPGNLADILKDEQFQAAPVETRVARLKQWVNEFSAHKKTSDPTWDARKDAEFRAQFVDRPGFMGGVSELASGIWAGLVDRFPEDMARAVRGGDVKLHGDEWTDRLIAEQDKDRKTRATSFQELAGSELAKSLQQGPQSVVTSMASGIGGMVAGAKVGGAIGAAAGAPAAGVGAAPGAAVGATIGGMVGAGVLSGASMYRIAKDSFLEQVRDKIVKDAPNITEDQWETIKAGVEGEAVKYGLWEAGPEALSQAFTAGLFSGYGSTLLRGIPGFDKIAAGIAENAVMQVAGKYGGVTAAKIGAEVGDEILTEGLTGYGQGAVEARVGLRDHAPTYMEATRESAGPAAVGAILQGGVMAGAQKVFGSDESGTVTRGPQNPPSGESTADAQTSPQPPGPVLASVLGRKVSPEIEREASVLSAAIQNGADDEAIADQLQQRGLIRRGQDPIQTAQAFRAQSGISPVSTQATEQGNPPAQSAQQSEVQATSSTETQSASEPPQGPAQAPTEQQTVPPAHTGQPASVGESSFEPKQYGKGAQGFTPDQISAGDRFTDADGNSITVQEFDGNVVKGTMTGSEGNTSFATRFAEMKKGIAQGFFTHSKPTKNVTPANEQDNQTTVPTEPEVRQDVPQSREMPVVPEQPDAQAPQGAPESPAPEPTGVVEQPTNTATVDSVSDLVEPQGTSAAPESADPDSWHGTGERGARTKEGDYRSPVLTTEQAATFTERAQAAGWTVKGRSLFSDGEVQVTVTPPAQDQGAPASEIRADWTGLSNDEREGLQVRLEALLEKNGKLEWKDIPVDLQNKISTSASNNIKEAFSKNPKQAVADLVQTKKTPVSKAPETPSEPVSKSSTVDNEQLTPSETAVSNLKQEEPAGATEPETPTPEPTEITPEYAEQVARKAVAEIEQDLGAVGLKTRTTKEKNGSGVFFQGGAIQINPETLSTTLKNIRIEQTANGLRADHEAWLKNAIFEEVLHFGQYQVANGDLKGYYDAIPDEQFPKGWEAAVKKSRTDWQTDEKLHWMNKAEFVRMALQGEWKGTITEAVLRVLRDVVDYLNGAAKNASPWLKEHVAEVRKAVEGLKVQKAESGTKHLHAGGFSGRVEDDAEIVARAQEMRTNRQQQAQEKYAGMSVEDIRALLAKSESGDMDAASELMELDSDIRNGATLPISKAAAKSAAQRLLQGKGAALKSEVQKAEAPKAPRAPKSAAQPKATEGPQPGPEPQSAKEQAFTDAAKDLAKALGLDSLSADAPRSVQEIQQDLERTRQQLISIQQRIAGLNERTSAPADNKSLQQRVKDRISELSRALQQARADQSRLNADAPDVRSLIAPVAKRNNVRFDGQIEVPGVPRYQFTVENPDSPAHKATFILRGEFSEELLQTRIAQKEAEFRGDTLNADAPQTEHKAIPRAHREAVLKVADAAVDAGFNTPEKLYAKLSEAIGEGNARSYVNAIWLVMRSEHGLPALEDWAPIFAQDAAPSAPAVPQSPVQDEQSPEAPMDTPAQATDSTVASFVLDSEEVTVPGADKLREQEEEQGKPEVSNKKPTGPVMKVQKAFLLEALDKAIAEAPETQSAEHIEARERYEAAINANKKDTEAEQKAIQEARDAYRVIGHITIDVPGDGIFTLVNTKQALKDFRKTAQKFPVATLKPEQPSQPSSAATAIPALKKPKSAGDVIKVAALVTGEDYNNALGRAVITYVYSDGKHTVATDGRQLLIMDGNTGGTEKAPVFFNAEAKTEVPKDKDGKLLTYPDWEQIRPDPKNMEKVTTVDTAALFKMLIQAKRILTEKDVATRVYVDKDGNVGITALASATKKEASGHFGMEYSSGVDEDASRFVGAFNIEFLLNTVKVARSLGHEKLTLNTTKEDTTGHDVISFTAPKFTYIMMPMRTDDGGKVRFGQYTERWAGKFGLNYKGENSDAPAAIAQSPEPSSSAPVQEQAPENAKPTISPITTLASFGEFVDALNEGTVTADQVKAAWEQYKSAELALREELGKLTKDRLLRMNGMHARPSDTKAQLIDGAISSIEAQFQSDVALSYGVITGDMEKAKRAAMDKSVTGWTDEKIQKDAQARKERKAAREKALTNPETLEEFQAYVRRQGALNPTPEEKAEAAKLKDRQLLGWIMRRGESKLTPEQRAKYDELRGIDAKQEQKQAEQRKAFVPGVRANVSAEIIPTKHTKTGDDLFVVKLADRVERDVYDRLNSAAKKLGGHYSSYAKNGAIPGFTFKDQASAEQFLAITKGESVDRSEQVQERREEKKSAAAERLRKLAQGLENKANEVLNADRKTNTARRARMAEGAENSARSDAAFAETLKNLADGMDRGDVTLLDNIKNKAQVETLNVLARFALQKRRSKLDTYDPARRDMEGREAQPDDMDHAEYPWPRFPIELLKEFIEAGRKTTGSKLAAERVAKIRPDANDDRMVTLYSQEAEAVKELIGKVKNVVRGYDLSNLKSRFDHYDHVSQLGLTDLPMLRAALREFLQFRKAKAQEDPLKKAERALIGQKIPGFFPTPKALAERMVEEAGITPGMTVLEPSAGKGDLADAAKQAGAEVDTVERMSSLRELLELRGHRLIGHDFTQLVPHQVPVWKYEDYSEPARRFAEIRTREDLEQEYYKLAGEQPKNTTSHLRAIEASTSMTSNSQRRAQAGNVVRANYEQRQHLKNALEIYDFYPDKTKGGGSVAPHSYDRIVMNPPFEDGQDIAHVQHAFKFLKPGGKLVAIMSEGPFFRNDKTAREFREWLESTGGTSEKLPEGSFDGNDAFRQTGTNTRLVVIEKPTEGGSEIDAYDPEKSVVKIGSKWTYRTVQGTENQILVGTRKEALERAKEHKAFVSEMQARKAQGSDALSADAPVLAGPDQSPVPVDVTAYHGSPTQFDAIQTKGLGAHFTTDRSLAERFSEQSGNVKEARVRLTNPLRITDHGMSHSNASETINDLVQQGVLPDRFSDKLDDRLLDRQRELMRRGTEMVDAWNQASTEALSEVREHLQGRGHDGLIYVNKGEGNPIDTYVVFETAKLQPPAPSVVPQTQSADMLSADAPRVSDLVPVPTVPKPEPVTQEAQIESIVKRLDPRKGFRWFWEGTADVLERSGFKRLADAVWKQQQETAKEHADAWRPHARVLDGMTKKEQAIAKKDWALYFRHQEQAAAARKKKNDAKAASRAAMAQAVYEGADPKTKALIDAWKDMAEMTGQRRLDNNVLVKEQNGTWRPMKKMGKAYFPKKMNRETIKVLENPQKYPKEWERMVADLMANGNIKDPAEADRYIKERVFKKETDWDFYSSIEQARGADMPESWMDYDWDEIVPWYVTNYARRMGQIKAYGQSTTETKDLWDTTIASVPLTQEGLYTQEYLKAAAEAAKFNRYNTQFHNMLRNLQTVATGALLSSPFSAVRNLISGTTQTAVIVGPVEALAQTWRAMTNKAHRMTAHDLGVIRSDLFSLTVDAREARGEETKWQQRLRQWTAFTLEKTGFNLAENIVRTTGAISALNFARKAAAELQRDAGSAKSAQYMAVLRRMRADPLAVVAEFHNDYEGDAPATAEFVRQFVTETQGGYTFAQTPLHTTEPTIGFLMQFQKWGTQMTRFLAKHVITPLKGDIVEMHVDHNGKKHLQPVPGSTPVKVKVRDVRPFMYVMALAILGGEGLYWLKELLTGRGRPDSTFEEIGKADTTGDKLALFANRLASDVLMAGTLGMISDYAANLREFTTRGRFKNPLDPPGIQFFKNILGTGRTAWQQNGLTGRDVLNALEAQFPGVAFAERFTKRIGGEDVHEARNVSALARDAGMRAAKALDMPVRAPFGGDAPIKTPNTPFYNDLENALLSGDSTKARELVRDRLAGKTSAEREKLMKGMKSSTTMGQPIRIGGYASAANRLIFLGWARKHIASADYQRITELDRRYWRAATAAGLSEGEPVPRDKDAPTPLFRGFTKN